MSKMSPVYTLTYFNLRSRAEPIRLLLAHAGIEFEDVRIENTWNTFKDNTPWGKLPVLEDGDFVLSESLAILEYLGRKHGYDGDTDMDAAKCNEYVRSMADLREAYMDYVFETNQDEKEEKLEKISAGDDSLLPE